VGESKSEGDGLIQHRSETSKGKSNLPDSRACSVALPAGLGSNRMGILEKSVFGFMTLLLRRVQWTWLEGNQVLRGGRLTHQPRLHRLRIPDPFEVSSRCEFKQEPIGIDLSPKQEDIWLFWNPVKFRTAMNQDCLSISTPNERAPVNGFNLDFRA
jgi:hypothetical protein